MGFLVCRNVFFEEKSKCTDVAFFFIRTRLDVELRIYSHFYNLHVLEILFFVSVPQDECPAHLRDILRREMSVYWMMMMPTATLLSLLVDLALYVKDRLLIPILYKPWRYPFLLLHYVLKHDKLHQL